MLFFYAYVVYAHNSMSERKRIWHDPRVASGIVGNEPWIQMGDYNLVRRISE